MQEVKLFENGRSKAIRIPRSFGFNDCKVLYIEKDERTGNLIISKTPKTFGDYFEQKGLFGQKNLPQDFMNERDDSDFEDKDLF